MVTTIINKTILIIWTFFSAIFILTFFTDLEITLPIVRIIIFLLTVLGIILIILKLFKIKISSTVYIIIIISVILVGGIVITQYNWTSKWKTQTVLFENGHFKNKTIEFQTQDKGALGNNLRIVEVTNLTGFLKVISLVDTTNMELPWIKADIEVNELQLKYK